jgi:hypothetical protein
MTTTAPHAAPAPGIYDGTPAATYHAWPGASNSRLSDLRRSPAHMIEGIRNPKPSTAAQIVGDAAHLAILEPELFGTRYVVAEQCAARKRGGERCTNGGKYWVGGDWFCGVHMKADDVPVPGPDDPAIIPADDYDICAAIARSVRQHPAAAEMLRGRQATELSARWVDERTGVMCKARLDGVAPQWGTVIDIKTTRDASPEGFQRAIFQYGYFRQAAHYLAAMNLLHEVDFQHFVIIAVEKEPPYAVGVYRLLDAVVQAGRGELDELLPLYAECERTGIYPGYGDEVQEIGLPSYAWKQLLVEV